MSFVEINVKSMLIDKKYTLTNKDLIIKEILRGSIFIYPTDTIYGIGCNALNKKSISKIRRLKQREIKPFSVIAPNMLWIRNSCNIDKKVEKYLDKLPGPYTLFLRLQDGIKMPEEINPLENGTIGVRIPRHWFTSLISEANIPFITTSVNLSGKPYMTKIDDLDETIKNNVDFIIYEGKTRSKESTKIDLTG